MKFLPLVAILWSQSGSLVHVNFQVRSHAGNELKCVTDVIQLGSSAGHTTLNVQLSDPSIDSSFHGRPAEFQSWNYISSVLERDGALFPILAWNNSRMEIRDSLRIHVVLTSKQ